MKKILAISAIALIATSTEASYLYWQVDPSDTYDSTISAETWGGITHARVAVDKGESGVSYGVAGVINDNGNLYAGPTSIDVGSGFADYSYYIELGSWNSSNQEWSGVASSKTFSYSDIAASAFQATSTLEYAQLAAIMPFHGGTYSVPEPTSAMLMLFGAAFLGLKRKNRSLV